MHRESRQVALAVGMRNALTLSSVPRQDHITYLEHGDSRHLATLGGLATR